MLNFIKPKDSMVCNIGEKNVKMRFYSGIAAFAVAFFILVIAIFVEFPVYLLIPTLFIPCFFGFFGILQAYTKFCVGFAIAGSVDPLVAGGSQQANATETPEYRQARLLYSLKLVGFSAFLAAIDTAIVVFILLNFVY